MDRPNHKYIRKEMGANGQWRYIYARDEMKEGHQAVPLGHMVVSRGSAYKLHQSDESGVVVERLRDQRRTTLTPEQFQQHFGEARDFSMAGPPNKVERPAPRPLNRVRPAAPTRAAASAGLDMTPGQLAQGQENNNAVHRQAKMAEHGKIPTAVPGTAGTPMASARDGLPGKTPSPQAAAHPEKLQPLAPGEPPEGLTSTFDRAKVAKDLAAQLRQHGWTKQADELEASLGESTAPAAETPEKKQRQSFKSGARNMGMLRTRMELRKKALLAMANPAVQADPVAFRAARAAAEKYTAQANEVGKGMEGFRPLGAITHQTVFAAKSEGGLEMAHSADAEGRLRKLMGGRAAPGKQPTTAPKPVESLAQQRTREMLETPAEEVDLVTTDHGNGQTDVSNAAGDHLFTAPTEKVEQTIGKGKGRAPRKVAKDKAAELAAETGATPPAAPTPPLDEETAAPADKPPTRYAQMITAFNALPSIQEQIAAVRGLGKELRWTKERTDDLLSDLRDVQKQGPEAIDLDVQESWNQDKDTYASATPAGAKKARTKAAGERVAAAAPLGRLQDSERASSAAAVRRREAAAGQPAAPEAASPAAEPALSRAELKKLQDMRLSDLLQLKKDPAKRAELVKQYQTAEQMMRESKDIGTADMFVRHLTTLDSKPLPRRQTVQEMQAALRRRIDSAQFPKNQSDWNSEQFQEVADKWGEIAASPRATDAERAHAQEQQRQAAEAAAAKPSKWFDTGLKGDKHRLLNDVQDLKSQLDSNQRGARERFSAAVQLEQDVQRLARLQDKHLEEWPPEMQRTVLAGADKVVEKLKEDRDRDPARVEATIAKIQESKQKLSENLAKLDVKKPEAEVIPLPKPGAGWDLQTTEHGIFATRQEPDGTFKLRNPDGTVQTFASRGEMKKAFNDTKFRLQLLKTGHKPGEEPAASATATPTPAPAAQPPVAPTPAPAPVPAAPSFEDQLDAHNQLLEGTPLESSHTPEEHKQLTESLQGLLAHPDAAKHAGGMTQARLQRQLETLQENAPDEGAAQERAAAAEDHPEALAPYGKPEDLTARGHFNTDVRRHAWGQLSEGERTTAMNAENLVKLQNAAHREGASQKDISAYYGKEGPGRLRASDVAVLREMGRGEEVDQLQKLQHALAGAMSSTGTVLSPLEDSSAAAYAAQKDVQQAEKAYREDPHPMNRSKVLQAREDALAAENAHTEEVRKVIRMQQELEEKAARLQGIADAAVKQQRKDARQRKHDGTAISPGGPSLETASPPTRPADTDSSRFREHLDALARGEGTPQTTLGKLAQAAMAPPAAGQARGEGGDLSKRPAREAPHALDEGDFTVHPEAAQKELQELHAESAPLAYAAHHAVLGGTHTNGKVHQAFQQLAAEAAAEDPGQTAVAVQAFEKDAADEKSPLRAKEEKTRLSRLFEHVGALPGKVGQLAQRWGKRIAAGTLALATLLGNPTAPTGGAATPAQAATATMYAGGVNASAPAAPDASRFASRGETAPAQSPQAAATGPARDWSADDTEYAHPYLQNLWRTSHEVTPQEAIHQISTNTDNGKFDALRVDPPEGDFPSTGNKGADNAIRMVQKLDKNSHFGLGLSGRKNKKGSIGYQCSSFASRAVGIPQMDTDSMYRDARRGHKHLQQVSFEDMQAGDLLVYPDHKDEEGKHDEGHVAVVVDANPQHFLIADASWSANGVHIRRIHPNFVLNKQTIAARPTHSSLPDETSVAVTSESMKKAVHWTHTLARIRAAVS